MTRYLSAFLALFIAMNPTPASWGGGSCYAGPAYPTPQFPAAAYWSATPVATQQPVASATGDEYTWGPDNAGRRNAVLYQHGQHIGAYTLAGSFRPRNPYTGTWGPEGTLQTDENNKPLVNYGIDVERTKTDVAEMKKQEILVGSGTLPNDAGKPRVVIRGEDAAVRANVDAALQQTGLGDKYLVNQYPADHWALAAGYDKAKTVSIVGPPNADGRGVMVSTSDNTDVPHVAAALRKADAKFDPNAVRDLSQDDLVERVKAFLASKGPVGDYTWGVDLLVAAGAFFLYRKYQSNKPAVAVATTPTVTESK